MFIVDNYFLAIIFCFVTMICWGSWGNTQKLASKSWRYELFYWDYVLGMVLFALFLGLTMGSTGEEGRSFMIDLAQGEAENFSWIVLGGVVFNASNILLSASVSLAGMATAFPLGVGIALVLGVVINYLGVPAGNPLLLFGGIVLIVLAIICNGVASGKTSMAKGEAASANKKGIVLALLAGVLMSLFFRFVVKGMDMENFKSPQAGMFTPYSAIFIFSLGVLVSNVVFNTIVMKYPFVGSPVSYREYFKGSAGTHLTGMLGGAIWALGSAFSYIASGQAGPAISYALGQGAPMIAAIWGVFIWKEYKGVPAVANYLLTAMFVLFIVGLGLVVAAGNG